MAWIIAIDAGTTGVRAVASRFGSVSGTDSVPGSDDVPGSDGDPGSDGVPWSDGGSVAAYREFTQHFPRPGWVEHDPEEIWQVTRGVLAEVVGAIRCASDDEPIAGIGITNQRETIVAWDARDGRARHNAIVWQDRRTSQRCAELRRDGELARIREQTGLVLDPYFSATKAEWLLGPGGVSADEHLRLGTIDSWLIWNLTDGAVHATDVSNASRTMLFDINALVWSPGLLDLFGIPGSALPEVLGSAGVLGRTTAGCPTGAGVPIAGIAGDQQASLFGQACVRPGMAKNTYGTGSFVLMNVGEEPPSVSDALLRTVAWQLPARMLGDNASGTGSVTHYALEGAIFSTGSAVQWLRDGLGIIAEASELEPLAGSVEDAAGVYLVPAFTGLGSPWWEPDARGTVVGITRGTTRVHLARAAIDAMVHQSRDVVDAMVEVCAHELTEMRVDGGAAVMDALCQAQADQLGVIVARSRSTESTALGATNLAALGCGLFGTVEEVAAAWSAQHRFEPGGDRGDLDAAHDTWRRAVRRAIDFGRTGDAT